MTRRKNAPDELVSIERSLGQRLRQRRLIAGMTLDAVAAQLGISVPQVHRFEMGLRTMDVPTLVALTAILKCQVTDLLTVGPNGHDLSKEALNVARLMDSLNSVGLRNTLRGFVAKLAAWDREKAG